MRSLRDGTLDRRRKARFHGLGWCLHRSHRRVDAGSEFALVQWKLEGHEKLDLARLVRAVTKEPVARADWKVRKVALPVLHFLRREQKGLFHGLIREDLLAPDRAERLEDVICERARLAVGKPEEELPTRIAEQVRPKRGREEREPWAASVTKTLYSCCDEESASPLSASRGGASSRRSAYGVRFSAGALPLRCGRTETFRGADHDRRGRPR